MRRSGAADDQNPLLKVSSRSFYDEYNGHKVEHLEPLLEAFRRAQQEQRKDDGENDACEQSGIIWTAGDSSLDNKYWFNSFRTAVQGPYRDVLQPPKSNADVTYWLNRLLYERRQQDEGSTQATPSISSQLQIGHRFLGAMNTAVEATTLNERTFRLRPQDEFLRDNIQPDDVLIVSIGGNDVALAPLPCTIASILGLICCLPTCCMEHGGPCCPKLPASIPIDDRCYGCGPSLCSCCCAMPPCFGYLHHLFHVRVEHYIKQLTSKTKPKQVLVCMIYYPDENVHSPSWASAALSALGYNSNPQKLQVLIQKAFQDATSTIQVPGTVVTPVPLFMVLDGKTPGDYVARVEPSPQGGRKMAEYLLQHIATQLKYDSQQQGIAHAASPLSGGAGAPSKSYMTDR
eukprot:CAMPEP_0198121914 /NCGR_PEP_ID=MMETSP1442-20131203/33415_1 /TAXON_ID= /ORGANISM="Craspedostauros australis, Strain CCMP3328" /LENGTH=401 /DNA_ID=CAMNT_0043780815 /DNA_START=206 /DNA_END=1411 /DNA_ORIENTATION=-